MVVLAVQTPISPVQSFKKFLKSPSSSPARSVPPSLTTPAEPARLPANVIYEIARHLDLRGVLQLGLCSHRTHTLVASLLYHTVDLKSTSQCKITLLAMSKRPATERSVYVKRLILRPNNPEWSGDPTSEPDPTAMQLEEDRIAKLVGLLARKGHLSSLDTFEWDGREMPGPDMWEALRLSCQHLQRIGTSIGEESLDASSPLWDFNDLRHIGIHVKCHSLDWLADGIPHHKASKLPRKFWAMLLERSPRLESLVLGGPAPAPRIFDVRHFTSGRWPRLRELVLGDVAVLGAGPVSGPASASVVGSDSGRRSRPGSRGSMEGGASAAASSISSCRDSPSGELQSLRDQAAFMAFFMAHPNLQSIKLLHAPGSAFFPTGWSFPVPAPPPPTSFPNGYQSYPPSSFPLHPRHHPPAQQPHPLPHLQSLTAPLKWVRTLAPQTRRNLRRLTLTGMGMGMGTGGASAVRTAVGLLSEMNFGNGRLEALGLWGDLSAAGLGGLVGGLAASARGRRMSLGGGGAEETDEGLIVLAALLRAVPAVKEVDVVCFTRVAFGVRDFAPIMQDLPSLRSFALTKVHKSGDEDLLRGATRLVQAHRAANGALLERVSLRETHGAWFSASGGRVKARGMYEVVLQQQQPVLVASEWGVRSRGLAMAVAVGAREYRRCYVRPLPAVSVSGKEESAKLHRRRASEASASIAGMRCVSSTEVVSPRSSISSGTGSATVSFSGSTPFRVLTGPSIATVQATKTALGRSGSDASTSESSSASSPAAASGSSVAGHSSGSSVEPRPMSSNGHRHSASAGSIAGRGPGKGMRAFLSRRASWIRGASSGGLMSPSRGSVDLNSQEEQVDDDDFVLI